MLIGKQTILRDAMDSGNIINIGKDVADIGQDFLDSVLSIEQNII